jgi:hypothetical protein
MIAVAGDRTRVTGGTGGITHHYTTTTAILKVKNKSARQKRIAEQRKQKDEFNIEPNCIRNTTHDLIIGMDI